MTNYHKTLHALKYIELPTITESYIFMYGISGVASVCGARGKNGILVRNFVC